MTHWSERFIGLPFADLGRDRSGVDCWGLVRLALEHHGIDVPSYAGGYADVTERAEIAGLINGAKPSWTKVVEPRELDVITFRRGRLESHVGLIVRPGWMLHVTEAIPSRLEDYRDDYWWHRRTGFWRHTLLSDGGRS